MGKRRRSKSPPATWDPKTAPVPKASEGSEPAPVAERMAPDPMAPDPTEAVAVDEPPRTRPESPPETIADDAVAAPAVVTLPVDAIAMRPIALPLALPVAADAIAPGPIAVFADPDPGAPPAPIAPVRPAAGFRMASPERLDVAGIGATITGYMRGESEAAVAHLRALFAARSPADLIRLQAGEIQRAADASLSCWSQVARKVGRVFAYR